MVHDSVSIFPISTYTYLLLTCGPSLRPFKIIDPKRGYVNGVFFKGVWNLRVYIYIHIVKKEDTKLPNHRWSFWRILAGWCLGHTEMANRCKQGSWRLLTEDHWNCFLLNAWKVNMVSGKCGRNSGVGNFSTTRPIGNNTFGHLKHA